MVGEKFKAGEVEQATRWWQSRASRLELVSKVDEWPSLIGNPARQRSSTAQKFWRIDNTRSYVPDRDAGCTLALH